MIPRLEPRTAEQGFTIIELITVVLLIGLTLAVATPAFNHYRFLALRRQASGQLIDDIRAARQLAITQRMPVYFQMGNGSSTTNLTTYKVHGDKNANGSVGTTEYNLSQKMPKGSKMGTSLTPKDTLIFDINGLLQSRSKGGSLFVQSDTRIDTVTISVSGIPYLQ